MTLLIMRGLHLKKLAKKYRQTHTERMAVNGQPPLLESEKNTAFQLFDNMQHSCWRDNGVGHNFFHPSMGEGHNFFVMLKGKVIFFIYILQQKPAN